MRFYQQTNETLHRSARSPTGPGYSPPAAAAGTWPGAADCQSADSASYWDPCSRRWAGKGHWVLVLVLPHGWAVQLSYKKNKGVVGETCISHLFTYNEHLYTELIPWDTKFIFIYQKVEEWTLSRLLSTVCAIYNFLSVRGKPFIVKKIKWNHKYMFGM